MDGVSACSTVRLVRLRVGLMPENILCSCSCLYHAATQFGLLMSACSVAVVAAHSFIHSIHYLGSSVVCLLSMAQRIFSYLFYLLPPPLPYPTLALSYFIYFGLFVCPVNSYVTLGH